MEDAHDVQPVNKSGLYLHPSMEQPENRLNANLHRLQAAVPQSCLETHRRDL